MPEPSPGAVFSCTRLPSAVALSLVACAPWSSFSERKTPGGTARNPSYPVSTTEGSDPEAGKAVPANLFLTTSSRTGVSPAK